MTNRDLEASLEYHERTKHSAWSVQSSGHTLDWPNQPIPFKIYPTLKPALFEKKIQRTEVPALLAVSGSPSTELTASTPTLEDLAQLLYFSAGIIKKADYPGTELYFRAASCTGALYEIELYVVCRDLPDLDAGVYQFGASDFGLRKLRDGDHRGCIAAATAADETMVHAPVVIVCTGTYWRNAWKYESRTYRHFGWDNGTILANMLAVSAAMGVPARVYSGFVDEEVNRVLDLDTEREVAFSLVSLGVADEPAPEPQEQLPALNLATVPLSPTEVRYPAMNRLHEASSLTSTKEVTEWKGSLAAALEDPASGAIVKLTPQGDDGLATDAIESVILRRGSTRQFSREPIALEQLSTMLDRATRGISADFLLPPGSQLNDLYLIVNAVDGIKPGAYFYRRINQELECLKEGDFRGTAAHLGLDQALPGDASVALFFLADLRTILERFGNRGYRATQLEAGIIGGKLYLAAYAQRLGATGLTFYDDEVTEFFSPHAAGKSAIFLMALGRSVKRK